ncbi:unnamed protein product [Parnassius apollo]|uniref:(apollo) hypothetical protein n=1 Tax=Parnassius apollo TaxID=110799 RepID=A0A8S3WW06_PARAO|nr:unnamed protein product [Parnassius apollo]
MNMNSQKLVQKILRPIAQTAGLFKSFSKHWTYSTRGYVLILSKNNCFAWSTSESSKTLSALLDKFLSDTEGKYFKDGKENNNDTSRWANDSKVIYFKLAPIGSYDVSFKSNNESTNIKSNKSTSLSNLNRKPKFKEAQNVTFKIKSQINVQDNKDDTSTKMIQESQDVNQTAGSALNENQNFEKLFQHTSPITDSTIPSLGNQITYSPNTEEIKNNHNQSVNNLLKVIEDENYDKYSSAELYLDSRRFLKQVDEIKSPQRKVAIVKPLDDAITYRVGYPANEMFISDQPDGVSSVFSQPSLLGLEKPKITSKTVFNYNAYPLNCKFLIKNTKKLSAICRLTSEQRVNTIKPKSKLRSKI